MNTLSKRAAIVTVFAVCLIGCGDDGDSTKAGSASPPVTLRIGTPTTPGAVADETRSRSSPARSTSSLTDGS